MNDEVFPIVDSLIETLAEDTAPVEQKLGFRDKHPTAAKAGRVVLKTLGIGLGLAVAYTAAKTAAAHIPLPDFHAPDLSKFTGQN